MKFFYCTIVLSFLIAQSELSDRYTTLQEIEDRLNDWNAEFGQNSDPYPNPGEEGIIYHHEIIGYSGVENLPIWAVKLTMNADIDEDKPRVLILGQCHAEEIYGVEVAMDLIDWMLHPLDHPSFYQSIFAIMSSAEIWIVPTYNPEGLSVVHGWEDDMDVWNQDVYYRKNKYDANQNNFFDYMEGIGNDFDGVDLNRNYDFNWIFGDEINSTDSGCGANPSYIANYDYYRGPSPFSENEVVVIRDFAIEKQFLLSIAYHSSRSGCVAEKVIYPWEWDVNKKSPDFDAISRLGYEISQFLPKEAESGFYAPASSISRRGNAHDWFYANTGCIQYLIEVGTENMQPDDINIIDQTIEKNIEGAIHLLKRAAGTNIQGGPEQYQITGLVTDSQTAQPLQAEVKIIELDGPMLKPRYADEFGRYRRLLIEGTYTIVFSAHGYQTQEYTFVPSSNQATEYNVQMIPLNRFNLSMNLNLPPNFDESLMITIEKDNYSEILDVNQNLFNFPEGEYLLTINSENLFPEIVEIDLIEDINLVFNCSWKSTIFYDDFLNLNNWSNSGGWIVENSILKSQQDFLYNHEVNNIITSNQGLAFVGGVNYVMTLDTRYELEWDNDYVSIYRNCEECSNNELFHLSNTDYEWQQLYSPFNSVQGPITYDSFSINFITDHSLNYRGFELNNLSILAKPMYAYCYTSDLNQDAIIDINDVVRLVEIIFEDNASGFESCVANVFYDDFINIIDIVELVNFILINN